MSEVLEFIRAHDLVCWDAGSSIFIFDAPPDHCGVYVTKLVYRCFAEKLEALGWAIIYEGESDTVGRLRSLYALDPEPGAQLH